MVYPVTDIQNMQTCRLWLGCSTCHKIRLQVKACHRLCLAYLLADICAAWLPLQNEHGSIAGHPRTGLRADLLKAQTMQTVTTFRTDTHTTLLDECRDRGKYV